MVSYSHQQQRLGDIGQILITDETPDPDQNNFTRSNRIELGFHQRLRPGSDLMFYFSGNFNQIVSDDGNAVPSQTLFSQCQYYEIPPPCGFMDRRSSFKGFNLTFQAAHYLKVNDFGFKYGLDFLGGHRNDNLYLYYRENEVFPEDDHKLIVQDPIVEEQNLSYRTLFLHSNYHLDSDLTLNAGLNYEWSNDDNIFIGSHDITGIDENINPIFGENKSDWRLNPQFGAIYEPFESSTLRVAVMSSRQELVSGGGARAFARERLVPVHLNGFLSNLNLVELGRSWSYNLGWDQRIGENSLVRTSGFFRNLEIPHAESGPMGFLEEQIFEGKLYGAEVILNHSITPQLSFVASYEFSQDEDFFSFRREHELNTSLFYVHPQGFSLSVRENFFQQKGHLEIDLPKTRVFTTDLSIKYEFPENIGALSLQISNLFDHRYQFLVDPLTLNQRIPKRQFEFILRWYL